jgi:hypothetical protein
MRTRGPIEERTRAWSARRLLGAIALLLGVTACGSEEPRATGSIRLELAAGSAAARSGARAEALTNLEALPRPEAGAALVAAGRFEPAGLVIPEGLEATWPLAAPREPGERLWIAVLDERAGRWLGTGERAVVAPSGREASGRLFHFSTIGLLNKAPSWKEAPREAGAAPTAGGGSGTEKDDEERGGPRVKRSPWRFVNVFAEVRDLRGFDEGAKKAAAEDVKKQLAKVGDGDDYRAIGDLFEAHPFPGIEAVAKQKGGSRLISEADSAKLAAARREMINQAMGETMRALDPEGRLTIGMLDSGNKNSGIASDVDQTVFVMPKDLAATLKPAVTEATVIARFNQEFKKRFGTTPERMGIESLNGADFYPDWRQKQTVAGFVEEADRVVDEKRKNPEAYRSEGQLKSQAEGRGYEALQEHHKRVSDLRAAQDAIEAIRGDPRLSEAEKAAKIQAETARVLNAHREKHPAASLDELAQKFRKDSPWTEVRMDPSTGKPVTSQVEDPKNKVLAQKPEFAQRFAFDGSWDNWIMFEHHPHNRRKYLLRSVAEGIGLVRKHPPGKTITTYEYEKAYGGADRAQRVAFLDDVYGHKPPEVRERYRKCLDVAAKERLAHKGAANPASGADYTTKEVLQEYWPLLDEKEAKLYQGMSREAVDAMLKDRALRAWEADAREIMLENLVRTMPATAALLDGRLSAAEAERVKALHPNATPEKLRAATRRQLYQGFRDLMTPEFAKHLVAPDKVPAPKHDLVARMLAALESKDRALADEVRRVAQDAAAVRLATDPGERTARQELYEYLHTLASERIAAGMDVYRQAKQGLAEGRYTREYVAEKMLRGTIERFGSMKAQMARSFGFDVTNVHLLLPEKGLPRVELEFGPVKWSAKEFMRNAACAGNVDSVLQVMLAYQQGTAQDAAWAAAFEIAMNVPGVAQANAVKDLVVHQRPEGVVMLGSAMLVPGVGQAFLVISIAKTSVILLGNAVLQPLKNDDADNLYQGFLAGEDPGSVRSRSQRANLLHFVPRRLHVVETKDADGKTAATPVWAPYSREEAVERLGVFPDEYEEALKEGLLGGGDAWDAAKARIDDAVGHPRDHFEAQRASMAWRYAKDFGAGFLDAAADDPEPAMGRLVKFFDDRIEDWVQARGEFAEFPENTLIARRFEVSKHLDATALRQKVAGRAAGDLVRSVQILRSVEEAMRERVRTWREERRRAETNARLMAIDDALDASAEADMARAVSRVVGDRRLEGRAAEPRVHVRAVLLPAGKAERPGEEPPLDVVFHVSVVADPETHPPLSYDGESAVYDVAVDWKIATKGAQREVTARVTVRDANKAEVGKPVDLPIGTLEEEASAPASKSVKAVFDLRGRNSQNPPDPKPGRLITPWGGAVEDFDPAKADLGGDLWGGEEVSRLWPELWIVWEDAPAKAVFCRDLVVSCPESGYEKEYAEQTHPRDRLPHEQQASSRANVFVLPLEWPKGRTGTFRVKGRIHAFDQAPAREQWASAKALARYEIDTSFQIPDRREPSGAKLVLRYERLVGVEQVASAPLSPSQKEYLVKYAKDGKVRLPVSEPYEEAKSDVFLKRWGDEPIGHDEVRRSPTFELNVRWKEAPPDHTYYFTLERGGGVPKQDEKNMGFVEPTMDFPPNGSRTGPGSTAFTVPVTWPFCGGTVTLTGSIVAIPKKSYPGKEWQQATPVATFPFSVSFKVLNRSRYAEGSVDVYGAKPAVVLLLGNVQTGKRPARVEAGGRTSHVMLPEVRGLHHPFNDRHDATYAFGVELGHGAEVPTAATVTFMDFGEKVTLPVTLKPARQPLPALETPNPQMIAYEQEALAKLAKLEALPTPNGYDLDAIAREYGSLAGTWLPYDYAKAQDYARRSDAGWRRLRETELAATKDPKRQLELRALIARLGTSAYYGAVSWLNPEALGLFGEAVSQVQAAAADPAETAQVLSGLYNNHANAVFLLTGDVDAAAAAWKTHNQHAVGASGPRFGDPSKEVNPWTIDPMFR